MLEAKVSVYADCSQLTKNLLGTIELYIVHLVFVQSFELSIVHFGIVPSFELSILFFFVFLLFYFTYEGINCYCM